MKSRPHQSKWSSSLKFGWSKSTSASTPMVMPMPGTMLMKNSQCHDIQSVMIAADRRPDGRRQRRDQADDRADDVEFRARKHRVGGREHGRDHAGAQKSLDRAPHDHLLDRRGKSAEEARNGEAGGGNRKQQPRAERARQESGQRDRDHFGDQIRGLDPRHFARACRQAGLDFGQRRRDDLDVQDRHEHPEHHDEERKQPPRRDALGRRSRGVHHGRRGGGGVSHDLPRSSGTRAGFRPAPKNYFGWTIAGASRSASLSASAAPSRVSTVV